MAVLSDDMGGITAYAAAVNRGYTGTKEEFEQLMYSYTEVAERAEAAAGNAYESEEASIGAKDIAVNAKNEAVSARDAAISARDASISAKNDSQSVRDAAISAKNDTLAAKDAVMDAKSDVDETSANFSDAVTAAISDVNAAGRNQKELAKTHAIDSEAWAVGQREGADVGVSDETYHNNSKYYAEQSALAKGETETARDAAITAKDAAEQAKADTQEIADGIQEQSDQIQINKEDISDLKNTLSDFETALETKAEIDGYYEDMTVGDAEQLVSSKYVEDSEPYLYRTTGGSVDVGNREYVDAIVGGTVNWNQHVPSYTFADRTSYEITYRRTDYKFTFSGTGANTGGYIDLNSFINILGEFVIGHKYLLDTSHNNMYIVVNSPYTDSRNTKIYAPTSTPTYFYVRLAVADGETVSGEGYANVFDLTAMFGSTIADYIYSLEQATAGDGVAWFKKLFPKDYYEYNSGELKSVEGLTSHDTVGFNQWDEEWEVGLISASTGQDTSSDSYSRTKNYIKVFPSTSYYLKNGPSSLYMRRYDENKNYVGYGQLDGNAVWITPADTHYIRLCWDGNTYNHDICINISDPAKNGTYEPYESHSYPLDSSVILRGIWELDASNNLYCDGDIYNPSGVIDRNWTLINLGTLDWTYDSANQRFYTTGVSLADNQSMICNKYVYVGGFSNAIDKSCFNIYNNRIGIMDTAYTDGATLKTALSGVYLLGKLATPTTEEAIPYRQLQICDPNGTEEFVSTGIVPVGHETRYPENLRAKIEGLPWNFASLIAPTESTFTATRNYTSGALLIVNNVLYKATANIANGATITPNTNVTATTLAEVIAAL